MKKKTKPDTKRYDDEFLQQFKHTAQLRHDKDFSYIYKYACDAVSPDGIDPRMARGPIGKNAKILRFVPGFILDRIHPTMDEKNLANFRRQCDEIYSAVCVRQGVSLVDQTIPAHDDYPIPVRIYKSNLTPENSPCLLFMHGGGFIAGSLAPYDEFLKVFVSKFAMTAISVDYRLLPEHPYPTHYQDCFSVLKHLYTDPKRYGIHRKKIFVCGDSAGGNIAQACTNELTSMVRGQILLYPTLNMFGIEDRYYHKEPDDFTLEPKQKHLLKGVIEQTRMMHRMRFGSMGIDAIDALNNPYSFGVKTKTPTFISVGALDYLKKDALGWAHKLQAAGVKVKFIMYGGLGHGYINAMGVFVQAEDVCDETGAFIKDVLNRL